MKKNKLALLTALTLSLCIFATSCAAADNTETTVSEDSQAAVNTDITESDTTESEEVTPVYAKDLFNSDTVKIWYRLGSSDIGKDTKISTLGIEENGTLTIYTLEKDASQTLGYYARIDDSEIVKYIKDNYTQYSRFNINDLQIYFETDSTGNNIVTEALVFPPTSDFEGQAGMITANGLDVVLTNMGGSVVPYIAEVYESHYYGYGKPENHGNLDSYIWVTRGTDNTHLTIDPLSLTGAHIDEKYDIHGELRPETQTYDTGDTHATSYIIPDDDYPEADEGYYED